MLYYYLLLGLRHKGSTAIYKSIQNTQELIGRWDNERELLLRRHLMIVPLEASAYAQW